ncbi:TPA: hypothetical protein JBI12_04850 [Legionella pneumophila]|nr:hypothetical protein [Legionella pneumophila]
MPQNTKIKIQDLIVLGSGEKPPRFYEHPKHPATTQVKRLIEAIGTLITFADARHKKDNYENGKLRENCSNNITRLATSEFFFYSQIPLTIQQFTEIQEATYRQAQTISQNIHLVLGTFAIQLPKEGSRIPWLLNVLVHVECGPKPKFNFYIKNYPDFRDERYKNPNIFYYLAKKDFETTMIPFPKVKISFGGEEHDLSFNNAFICETLGGEKFFSCVDICRDHTARLARNNLAKIIRKLLVEDEMIPTQLSHLISAATLDSRQLNIMHASDNLFFRPVLATADNPASEGYLHEKHNLQLGFGDQDALVGEYPPQFCSELTSINWREDNLQCEIEYGLYEILPWDNYRVQIEEHNKAVAAERLKREVEGLKRTFLDRHNERLSRDRNAWCGLFSLFTKSHVRADKSLKDLVFHAQGKSQEGSGHRSQIIMKELNWLDDNGDIISEQLRRVIN